MIFGHPPARGCLYAKRLNRERRRASPLRDGAGALRRRLGLGKIAGVGVCAGPPKEDFRALAIFIEGFSKRLKCIEIGRMAGAVLGIGEGALADGN